MTDADLLPPDVLKRKAVVYVRQSTQAQVQLNLESQRRHKVLTTPRCYAQPVYCQALYDRSIYVTSHTDPFYI